MSGEVEVLIWWVLFAGTHLLGSSLPIRSFLIRTITLGGFKALYSAVALATFVPLCMAYFGDKHAGDELFAAPAAFSYVAQALMLLSFVILLQGLFTTSPLTTLAEMSGKYGAGARGIQRVTRHPQNLAFVLFGVAHMLVNPFVGDWAFFGGFVVYGILGAIHQDRRKRVAGPEQARRLLDETSLIPFAAIFSGRQRLAPGETSWLGLLAAVVSFVLVRHYHGALFG